MRRNEKMRIIVIGNFTGYNVGDSIILESVLEDLHKYYPYATVVVPGEGGIKLQKHEGQRIVCVSTQRKKFALRFFSFQMLGEMIKADLLILTAGTIFSRRFGDINYSFMSTLIPTYRIAKMFNKRLKLICYNVGIAFDGSDFANKRIKHMLHDASIVALRHSEDASKLEGCCLNIIVSMDNVFGFNKPCLIEKQKSPQVIGINLSSYSVNNSCEDWKTWCLTFLEKVKTRFPTSQIKCIETTIGDYEFVRNLTAQNAITDVDVLDLTEFDYDDIAQVFSGVDIFAGMRMHSLIFALKQSVPSVGLAYDSKVNKLFHDLEMDSLAFDIKTESIQQIVDSMKKMSEEKKIIKKTVYSKMLKAYDLVNNNNVIIWRELMTNE